LGSGVISTILVHSHASIKAVTVTHQTKFKQIECKQYKRRQRNTNFYSIRIVFNILVGRSFLRPRLVTGDKLSYMPLSASSDQAIPVDVILVPQGQELAAVQAGCGFVSSNLVQALPVGPEPVRQFLEHWQLPLPENAQPLRVLVMGLCGALNTTCRIGDIVLYDTCLDGTSFPYGSQLSCDAGLNDQIFQKIQKQNPLSLIVVTAVTTDKVVSRATEKAGLASKTQADIVDMEGFVVLEKLQARGISVAMLRVVSDDCTHDLPDLSAAFSPTGDLLPFPLAMGMLRQPIGALRLIRGSLAGLKVLKQLATVLTAPT
jgi:hypothetical protein